MNIHHTKLVPINELTEATLLGRDEHELIEAAINHYLQHFLRLQGELKDEKRWWERRVVMTDKDRAAAFEDAAYYLGSKLQKLRKLSDEVANATEVHFIRQED
jgi:hypothetical protein